MPASKPFKPTPQAGLRAAASHIVVEFHKPVNEDDLEELLAGISPNSPKVKDAYIAYDNGFGHIVRTEPKGATS